MDSHGVECAGEGPLATVRDLMRRVHVTASAGESVGRALEKMRLFHTHLLVVMREQEVVGFVRDRGLIRVRASARTPAAVQDFMSRAIALVPPTMAAREAKRLLEEGGVDALAVVHHGTVIGLVSAADGASARSAARSTPHGEKRAPRRAGAARSR
jgi:CBS domain-containing protein